MFDVIIERNAASSQRLWNGIEATNSDIYGNLSIIRIMVRQTKFAVFV